MGTSAHAFGRVTERLWWTCPLGVRMKLRVGSAGSSVTVHKRRSWNCGEASDERLVVLGLGEEDDEVVAVDRDGDARGTAWGTLCVGGLAAG